MTTATVVELEFQVADSTYPFVQGSTLADGCRFELQSVVPQTDGSYLEFWNVTDDPPSQLDWRPQREGVEGWLLADPTDAGLFVFRISTTEIDWAPTLAAEGAIPREVWSDDGTGVIVADVLPWRDATDVVATVQCEHPSVTLTAKRERTCPASISVEPRLGAIISDTLTDRQREILLIAHTNGYFERPRETTGKELAAQLDIAPATFSQHLTAALDNLLSVLIDEQLLGHDTMWYDQ